MESLFYRVYPIGPDGRYLLPVELDCTDDAEAAAMLGRLGQGFPHGCDLWQLGRLVGRFRAGPDGGFVMES